MKIGIGYTTYLRPKHIEYCLQQVEKFKGQHDIEVYVWDDSDTKKGIAYGKNMCLFNLKHCDHIFLFDDDCHVIAEGWIDYFINSGYNHACYMNDNYQRVYSGDKHCSYNMSSGVFMYLTKECFESVGYFHPGYGRYGYEHAGYTHRIYQGGLTPSRFICLKDTDKYIYALDLQGIKGYEFLEHKRMITEEERRESLKINNAVYHQETTSHQVYYDFKP